MKLSTIVKKAEALKFEVACFKQKNSEELSNNDKMEFWALSYELQNFIDNFKNKE